MLFTLIIWLLPALKIMKYALSTFNKSLFILYHSALVLNTELLLCPEDTTSLFIKWENLFYSQLAMFSNSFCCVIFSDMYLYIIAHRLLIFHVLIIWFNWFKIYRSVCSTVIWTGKSLGLVRPIVWIFPWWERTRCLCPDSRPTSDGGLAWRACFTLRRRARDARPPDADAMDAMDRTNECPAWVADGPVVEPSTRGGIWKQQIYAVISCC